MDEIDYDLFSKKDLRVGEIISAEDVEGADKFLCLKIDIGSITKTIFAGIKKFYEPENLLGKKIIIVKQLPRNSMGKVQKNILRKLIFYHLTII